MPYLLDTNVLIRFLHRTDPHHQVVRHALRTLRSRGETLCFTSQNLGEFWNVCTRPATARGGFGLTIDETDRRARLLERMFVTLSDEPSVQHRWRQLLVAYAVSGVQVHDARLVAAMQVHGIGSIVTCNTTDFQRFSGITAVHPNSI